MNWLLPRIATAVLALALGALIGLAVGALVDEGMVGLLVGGAIGVGVAAAVDALRGHRLMRWLQSGQVASAPRDAGLWGELAYRIERALRARDRRIEAEQQRLGQFLAAIEASPNGVLLLDSNEQIEWFNAVAADHFGLDPQRDLRQRITNLVRAPAFVEHLDRQRFDEPVVLDGLPGRLTLSVLVQPYGEGSRLVLSQDITEHERTEAMRRDFVANVSHEIRTPLTVLAGFVETLSTLPLSDAERQRVLALMTQQTVRLQALVGDLLVLAELEGSPRPAADRWVAVDALLQRAEVEARQLSAGRHQIDFGPGAEATIAGNESELQSAIGNLVGNAVRYTPAGGRIQVRWTRRADGGADLDVVDTGIGIAREHQPRLTSRFYRVDSSRSRESGGTGLGLAIVKHVVQRHGGEIHIRSAPGEGSRFRLVFPASRVRHGAPTGPTTPAVPVR